MEGGFFDPGFGQETDGGGQLSSHFTKVSLNYLDTRY